jgi:hypothetical protein
VRRGRRPTSGAPRRARSARAPVRSDPAAPKATGRSSGGRADAFPRRVRAWWRTRRRGRARSAGGPSTGPIRTPGARSSSSSRRPGTRVETMPGPGSLSTQKPPIRGVLSTAAARCLTPISAPLPTRAR